MNLYEYAWSDPVNASDPGGLYTCEGTEAECEQIAEYINEARRAGRRQQTTGSRVMNYARALSEFYGAEGEENGVVVTNADLPD